MGKHHLVNCFRCGQPAGVTHISPAYGCRKCKDKLTPEQKQELHQALIARNREKRLAAKVAENAQDALQSQTDREAEPDSVFLQMSEQRRAQGPSGAELHAVYNGRAIVAKIIANQNYLSAVDRAMADFSLKVQRCSCCFTPHHAPEAAYTETFDGKLLCRNCAYGVIRCGWCGIHNNTLYPEVAATTKRIHPREYPPEVIAPFDAAAFG